MSLERQIAERRAQREADYEHIQTLLAELEGLDATIASLEARLQPTGRLAEMARTDAIVDVLRTAGKGLGPTEILSELKASGRDDKLRDVTATLDYLCGKKRVERVKRGSYVAL